MASVVQVTVLTFRRAEYCLLPGTLSTIERWPVAPFAKIQTGARGTRRERLSLLLPPCVVLSRRLTDGHPVRCGITAWRFTGRRLYRIVIGIVGAMNVARKRPRVVGDTEDVRVVQVPGARSPWVWDEPIREEA